MRHQKTRTTAARIVLGTALVLFPMAGYPLGLGKLKVRSALNEPLSAEIEFTSITEAELKGLSATLASRVDFEAAGAERLPFLGEIKFNVTQQQNGRYVLELKTEQPVHEPFLHLLLQVEWPGGRLVREYTALIDPPYYVAGKPAGISPPVTAPAVVEPVAEAPPAPVAPVNEAPAPTAQQTAEPIQAPETAPDKPTPAEPAVPAHVEAAPVVPTHEPAVDVEAFGPEQTVEVAMSAETGWPVDEAESTVEPLAPRAPQEAETPVEATTPTAGNVAVAPLPTEHEVKKGETLLGIAEKTRPTAEISVEQMALAIYRQNRHAFFANNLNNLRAGKILKLPETEALNAIAPNEARRELKVHYDSWQEYKLKLASASGGLKVADNNSEPAAAAAAPAPPPEQKPEAAETVAGPEDRSKRPEELLRIVRSTLPEQQAKGEKQAGQGETAKATEGNEQSALAERVNTLEESLESKQLEQKELSDRLGQVKSQIKNESRLLELENQGLAKAQAKATPEPAPAVTAPSAPAAKPETAAAETAATPVPPKTEVAPAPKPKKIVPPPAPKPPVEEKGLLASLIDDVMSNGLLPIVGGGLVLIGGAILLVYMRRRQRSIAEFEESILASDAVAPDASSTGSETTGQPVTTGDTSFLSDFSQGGMGHAHTDEVDPIAEAEVYLAYGRDETAEEILKEAIVKSPERHELKLKLLEIYHQRNDVNAFETLAEEMYAALAGRGGKVWEKVEELGRKLNPDNPMFRGGAPAARAGDRQPAEMSARAMDMAPAMTMAAAATTMVESAPVAASTEVISDFDFDTAAPATPTGDDFSLDFGSDVSGSAADDQAAPVMNHDATLAVDFAPSADATSSMADDVALTPMDLDKAFADNVVEFSGQAKGMAESSAADAGVGLADDEIKWELDHSVPEAAAQEAVDVLPAGNDGGQQWDETATKLDLAKAYIDMGDTDGARSILDEVLAEGNEDQKKQAAQLASQIA